MFNWIKESWAEAKGKQLRAQIEDIVSRLPSASPSTVASFSRTAHREFNNLLDRYNDFSNVSDSGRRKIGKSYMIKARELFDADMGAGYGMAVVGIYVEASSFSDPDAQFAHSLANEILKCVGDGRFDMDFLDATTKDRTEDAPQNLRQADPSSEADAAISSAISMSKWMGAEKPREAAEMMTGRPLSDAEWAEMKDDWEKHWSRNSMLQIRE